MKQLLLPFLIAATMPQLQGALILTEWMANPDDLSDDQGEYFEVYNNGPTPIDLDGLTIGDAGSDSFTISGSGQTIPVGSFFVFGDSENPTTPSYVDYAWPEGDFVLANGDDEIIISDSSSTLLSFAYSNGDPFGSGVSAALDNLSSDFTDESNFIAETNTVPGSTDLGSPGFAGVTVPEPSIAFLGALGLLGLVRRRR